ncbi:MAG: TonB-linked SusC/RagA family outer membrane protein, partial [Saprospiraceae bacterium]
EGLELEEIVVTALGISREKKGLTFAVDEVSSDELTTVKDANVINSLAGKSAGVFITRGGSGIGSSAKVIMRGNKSTTNGQPLYVIDGIPMTNSNTGDQSGVFGGSVDGGDGISNINSEDIESMSILKGASAAALYGSQAANGVILITTKKGVAGKPKISFSSSYITESVSQLPDLQYEYGQTGEGTETSWSSTRVDAPDHVEPFFQTGSSFINSISISGGTEKMQSYFSYSNTNAKGIVPTNELNRHNVAFNQTAKFFDNKLTLNANVNFINQKVKNRPAGGLYFNPLTGLYLFPRGLDFDNYKDNYEVYSADRNFNVQNWIADRDIQQNPYWILNRNLNKNVRNRGIASLSAKYMLTDWLSVQARGNMDRSFDRYTSDIYATTQGTLADANGRYIYRNTDNKQIYGDVILSANKRISDDLTLDVNLGTSHTNNNLYTVLADSKDANLSFANKFGLQFIENPIAGRLSEGVRRLKRNAIFASAQLGIKSTYYIDVTARNDFSSALPNDSYFYPSVGASVILSELMDVDAISFAKLRASYAIVGNDVPPYLINPQFDRGNVVNGQFELGSTAPDPNGDALVPEKSRSFEVGLDLRLLQNRVTLDLTYYRTNTTNQFIEIDASNSTLLDRFLVNGGDIQNSGIEAAIGLKVVDNTAFKWGSYLNFTANRNKVLEVNPLYDDADGFFLITNEAVNSYGYGLEKGEPFGGIYVVPFARDDQERIIIDADGKPMKGEGLKLVGNPSPDYMLGWTNEFSYKGVSLKFLIDGRFGGEVLSVTEALLDEHGVSQRTADARTAGGVTIDGATIDGSPVTSIPADVYYGAVGGRNGITENYIYDATNIRLRELAIGYSLPGSVMSKISFMESLKISLVGRNLFFFKNEAPFDPDVTFSTGVGLQGIDIFSLPASRTFGFNLSVGF